LACTVLSLFAQHAPPHRQKWEEGRVAFEARDYQAALAAYHEGLRLCLEQADTTYQCLIYAANISGIYHRQGQVERADSILQTQLKLAQSAPPTRPKLLFYNRL
ncbi:MAG: hypothetical protein AAFP02_10210, partial [Bacteroidota bacterium]